MRKTLGTVVVISMISIAGSVWLGTGTLEANQKDKSKFRTPGEVVADLQAAIDREDWESVASNYAKDAFIQSDQGILVGHEDIITSHQSIALLFNGVNPQIIQVTEFRDTVRVLYRLDAGWVVIPDGVDTYVVEKGLITRQTSHGLIEFTGPPPDQN